MALFTETLPKSRLSTQLYTNIKSENKNKSGYTIQLDNHHSSLEKLKLIKNEYMHRLQLIKNKIII